MLELSVHVLITVSQPRACNRGAVWAGLTLGCPASRLKLHILTPASPKAPNGL